MKRKEIFKTSGGKYIAPQQMENKYKESRFIEQIMVIGADKKFISALIVPTLANLKNYFEDHDIAWLFLVTWPKLEALVLGVMYGLNMIHDTLFLKFG